MNNEPHFRIIISISYALIEALFIILLFPLFRFVVGDEIQFKEWFWNDVLVEEMH
jgi:hypothetical protein